LEPIHCAAQYKTNGRSFWQNCGGCQQQLECWQEAAFTFGLGLVALFAARFSWPQQQAHAGPYKPAFREIRCGAFSGRGRDGMMQRSLSLGAAMPAAEAESGVRDKLQCRF